MNSDSIKLMVCSLSSVGNVMSNARERLNQEGEDIANLAEWQDSDHKHEKAVALYQAEAYLLAACACLAHAIETLEEIP